MPKKHSVKLVMSPECGENSLGLSPAVLAKRGTYQPELWCPKADALAKYYDPWCDPREPKTIHYCDCARARRVIKKVRDATRLMKSNECTFFDLNLYYKLETAFKTGSFHERGAIYALSKLNEEERKNGVVTASLGNWAIALTSEAKKMDIPVTIYFPLKNHGDQIQRCKDLGAKVEVFGKTLTDASKAALTMIQETGVGTYINGYDHPHVIAAAGTIGIEILEQMPDTDAIIVPVGGGGLIAGIAAVIKKLRPEILIYGVETNEGSCFFKALDNGEPYTIEVGETQNVPTAGYNAFHTARSLIDKMILVQDDWISQALAHLVEEERLVVEHRGALSLAVLFSEPNIVPELRCKNVVCVLSGSNYHRIAWPNALKRAKIIEGRLVTMEVACPFGHVGELTKIFRVLANLRCNIVHYFQENRWLLASDINTYTATIMYETRGWRHADTVKHVMNKLFTGMCRFSEEIYAEHDKCQCFPKLWNI